VHAVVKHRTLPPALTAALGLLLLVGCKERVTTEDCSTLVSRYAELVVREKMPDASPLVIEAERSRERESAKDDENFRHCTAEVRPVEYRCAMSASTADAFEKCLE
jgi:hypothetical protein